MIATTPYDALPATLLAELAVGGLDPRAVHDHVLQALSEDIPTEDVTSTATIDADARAVGDLAAREAGTVAGLGIAALVFHVVLGDEVEITNRVPDGTRLESGGTVVMRVAGPARGLLVAERTALNYASHLSGVATATAAWVETLGGTGAQVLDTRKTLPGYREMQKYAVRCGGGRNHRSSLSDRALIKDNHVVAAGGVVTAYRAVREVYPELRVEVEINDLGQLRELLDAGCQEILLDNMSTEEMAEAVRITGGRARLEASGGLTFDRAREVAATGVDYISVGALTHSVDVFDLGLDLHE